MPAAKTFVITADELEGKVHRHVSGQVCAACAVKEGIEFDRLEEANNRAGEILLHAMVRASRDQLAGVPRVAVASAAGLLMAARLSSSPLPTTSAERDEAFNAAMQAREDRDLLLAAFLKGSVRWEPFDPADGRGELAVAGFRYSTRLDADGFPELYANLRAALRGVR